jgi:hypothetical protein
MQQSRQNRIGIAPCLFSQLSTLQRVFKLGYRLSEIRIIPAPGKQSCYLFDGCVCHQT